MVKKRFDEIVIGEKITAKAVTITDTQVVLFAGLTGDFFPLHMNEVEAKKTPFGTRIAHGVLTFAIGGGMVADELRKWEITAALGYGNIKFPAPVKIGETIYPEAEVMEKTDKGNRGVVNLKFQVKTQDGVVAVDSSFQVMVSK